MKVPDDVRLCVAFVAYQTGTGDQHLAGTAFFLGEPIPDTESHFTWVATAAHVINAVRARSADGIVRLRVNSKGGGTLWLSIHESEWARHPSDDVAVSSVDLTDERLEFRTWRLGPKDYVTEEIIEEEGIGPGDDLFFPGLFVHNPGLDRNIPIIRVGNIAAMPSELRLSHWGKMQAYVVETRSIGGLSGSPVFVHLGIVRTTREGQLQHTPSRHGRFLLLGVMSGHYEGELTFADAVMRETAKDPTAEDRQVNMGLGIVVPIARVLEVINRPEIAEMKKREVEETQKQASGKTVADDAVKKDEPALRDRREFEKALRAVSRRDPSPPAE